LRIPDLSHGPVVGAQPHPDEKSSDCPGESEQYREREREHDRADDEPTPQCAGGVHDPRCSTMRAMPRTVVHAAAVTAPKSTMLAARDIANTSATYQALDGPSVASIMMPVGHTMSVMRSMTCASRG